MPIINFQDRGAGSPIILLHGFPMNSAVWDPFAEELSTNFRVITIDLPGFGESSILEAPFSIDEVAEEINLWLFRKQLNNGVVIGHSLGGYIALAMVDKNPEIFAGLGLFHSTAYEDSPDRKKSRTKAIEFIHKNGVLAFTSNFIPPLFFDPAHSAIEKVKMIAVQSTEEAVQGYIMAMRERPDRTKVLQKYKKPVLFIAGEKDGGIPVETILAQAILTQHPDVHILENVAHMGMYENFEGTLSMVRSFVKTCFG